MNKKYKWKLTKSFLRLLLVSAVTFLLICLFGLNDLTKYYQTIGYFGYKEIPQLMWVGTKTSIMSIQTYKLWSLITLIPIGLAGIVALIVVLTMIFKLKISNLFDIIMLCLGIALVNAVTSMLFVLITDPSTYSSIIRYAQFKDAKEDFWSIIPSVAIWLTAIGTVIMLIFFIIFLVQCVADAWHKVPRLKGEAKYYYNHYDKKQLAKQVARDTQVYRNANNPYYQQPQPAPYPQQYYGAPAQPQIAYYQQPSQRKQRGRKTSNNIRVTSGTPIPQSKTQMLQFVNCDDEFENQIRGSKAAGMKGTTHINVQKL